MQLLVAFISTSYDIYDADSRDLDYAIIQIMMKTYAFVNLAWFSVP